MVYDNRINKSFWEKLIEGVIKGKENVQSY